MIDPIGDIIKGYEKVTKLLLPPKSYCILRCDGRAFHTHTRPFKKPFDDSLISYMNEAAKAICAEIPGTILGYVQSDEISVIFSDLENENTQLCFGGNVQKITSISASVVSNAFNKAYLDDISSTTSFNNKKLVQFDSRVFTVPSIKDINLYLRWRRDDAFRNTVSSFCQQQFSHKELDNMSTRNRIKALKEIGIDIMDQPKQYVFGRYIEKSYYTQSIEIQGKEVECLRSKWVAVNASNLKELTSE